MRETLDFLRTALDGERTASGFKLESAPAQRVPIVLAALRGKMLELAVERADGAFTNFLPLGGLPKVTAQLNGAPDDFELLCRFFCLSGEREAVEPLARFMFSSYITVPVYAAFYRWLGYGDEIDAMVSAWESGDRQGAAAAAPWDLIEAMFIFGSPERDGGAHRRLRRGRHHAADPHPDHDARQIGRSDQRPRATLIRPFSSRVPASFRQAMGEAGSEGQHG